MYRSTSCYVRMSMEKRGKEYVRKSGDDNNNVPEILCLECSYQCVHAHTHLHKYCAHACACVCSKDVQRACA